MHQTYSKHSELKIITFSELSNETGYLLFTDKEIKAMKNKTTCPKSNSHKVAEPEF